MFLNKAPNTLRN
ncbi:hypothetical protein S40288_10336 [Stachybotrys chartarum IBT 40288]|nr:hypothetical protein S40288_10336 [Stachybotrys chartarum IBT 40288]